MKKCPFPGISLQPWVQEGADPWGLLRYRAQFCKALGYYPRSSWNFSHCELAVSDSQRAEERGQSKAMSNLIICCMTFTSAQYMKPLAHDSPVENGWRMLGITLKFTGRRAGATVKTHRFRVHHNSPQGPKMNNFTSTTCILPQEGESPFTALWLTDRLSSQQVF